MAPDPNGAIQIQIARDQAAAAWSAAHASWFAGVATTLAVVAAFVVQRLQAWSDQSLQARTTQALTSDALIAIRHAINFMEEMLHEIETNQVAMQPEIWLEAAQSRLGVLDYYLTRSLPSAHLVAAIVSLRPLLAATSEDLRSWCDHMHAMPNKLGPMEVRNRLNLRTEQMHKILTLIDPDNKLER